MEIRKYCDEQELNIKKLTFKMEILQQDHDFLDFELRNTREQNAELKVNISKNLTKLDNL